MTFEDEAIQKLDEQLSRIRGAVSETLAKADEARKRLPELQKQLAELIFKAAMGEATEADVNGARFAILYAERAVDAAELILEPARRASARLNGDSHKLSNKRRYRQEYEGLKAKITEAGTASDKDAGKLLDLCLTLNGNHAEANALLSSLRDEAA